MRSMRVIVLFVLSIQLVRCANILGIATLLSHSHHIWNEALVIALTEEGHNVTLLSVDSKMRDAKNYSLILLEDAYSYYDDWNLEGALKNECVIGDFDLWYAMYTMCESNLQKKGLQTLLDYPRDLFDLIIFDHMSGECFYPLIKYFGNPPVVVTMPFGSSPFIGDVMGNQLNTYIPYYSFNYDYKMNFWQRVKNALAVYYLTYMRKSSYRRRVTELSKKHFGEDIESIDQVERRFSVALINNDPVLNHPEAHPPNIIPVGGLQIIPAKPLPKELQKIFDESKSGVIYFALGTNVKPEKIDRNILLSFTKCFATLPYTVLWKIEPPKDLNLPSNVITRKWLPQNDILAQKNVKLFISHGGALSTQEAMAYGVPVLGLPFFLDQISNVNNIVNRKLGLNLEVSKLSDDYICDRIHEALDKEIYTNNMKEVSSRFRDQQIGPLKRAVFWVEYVLRHGSADHLSLSLRDMSILQAANVDILAFLLIVSLLPFILIYLLCRRRKRLTAKVKKN